MRADMAANGYEICGPGPHLAYLGRGVIGGLWYPAEEDMRNMPELDRRLCIALLELALENLRKDKES